MNRSYVGPTAAMVDKSLAALGYKPLPGLKNGPYLSGQSATKTNIMAALSQMATVTKGQDYGVIYYVGHGSITPSNRDLALSVWDRPVQPDEGVRVSDILGTLELHDWHSDVSNIPHYMLLLDACFSGNAALGEQTSIVTTNNVQRVVSIENQIVPKQIAILAATSDGDAAQAFDLHGTNLSAFGYYFSRAITEDWACADAITPDGILTLKELTGYLKSRLKLAWAQKATDAQMVPTILNKDEDAFIAYDPQKHALNGLRDEIVEIVAQTDSFSRLWIKLPNGNTKYCGVSEECRIPVSKALATGTLSVQRLILPSHGSLAAVEPWNELLNTPEHGTVDLKELVRIKDATVAGAKLSIK